MRRFLFVFIVMALLATQAGAGGADARFQVAPEVGSPVTIVGQDGAEVAQITVTEVVDPFESYDPAYPPERGYRMILVSVTVEATGAQPFSFNPSAVYLVDDAGYVGGGFYTLVPEDSGITLLAGQDVVPGTPVSGSLTFQAFSSAGLSSVVYWPQSDRLTPLARLGGTPPTVASTVTVMANDGTEAAKIAVLEIVDPFEEFDPSSPPQRGNHYVLIVVQIDNTGTRPMRVDPNAFQLLDSDGFLTRPSFVSRGDDPRPDLAYTDPFEPGQSVIGVVSFQVLSGTTQTSVLYVPSSDRLIEVAAVGTVAEGGTPVAAPADSGSPVAVQPDTGACAGFEEWSGATVDRFTEALGIAGALAPIEEKTVADAPAIRQAATDISALATAQEASSPPPAAQEFNALAVTYLTQVGQALDFLAEGLENGDPAQRVVALANLAEIEQQFAAGGPANVAFDELLAACPT